MGEKMGKINNLSKGNIYKQLIKLALPIMGTSFIQMSYGIMDMYWIGKLSTNAVASVAAVWYITWIIFSIAILFRVGSEIGVGQSVGRENNRDIHEYVDTGISSIFFLGILFAVFIFLFNNYIISIFNFESNIVKNYATIYLKIIAISMPFYVSIPVIGGVFNGAGNSRAPFIINTVGLVFNMVFDPIFIFVFDMGVAGAAIATALANIIIVILFIISSKRYKYLFCSINIAKFFNYNKLKDIIRWGFPSSIQSIIFAGVSMYISRSVNSFGTSAFAAYSIAVEIESIGWRSFVGFSTSIAAFSAQNFGAKKIDRLIEGYIKGNIIASFLAIVVSFIFFFLSFPIISIFLSYDLVAIAAGGSYLKINSLCQVFSAWEYSAAGAFQGMGITKVQSITGILFNFLRIPLSAFLSLHFGLHGIWWALCISSIGKGIVMKYAFHIKTKELKKEAS